MAKKLPPVHPGEILREEFVVSLEPTSRGQHLCAPGSLVYYGRSWVNPIRRFIAVVGFYFGRAAVKEIANMIRTRK
jgi:hypothetical protein